MNEALLRCATVTRRFGPVLAVDNVNLTLAKGQILALLGPSGCGKTTLLRLIAGFERPDSGTIELGDRMLTDARMSLAPEKRRVGLVFQEYALFNHLSVEANVRFGLPRSARRSRVDELLETVGLAGLGRRMPHQLSGGQQQRVALARTLAAEPELVLLDEPFSNLDPGLREQVREDVWRILEAQGATAIIVTHDQEEALSLPGEVAVMMHGRLLQQGPARVIYERPASREVATFVGDANILPAWANGDEADSDLGRIALGTPEEGETEVMVRPEHIQFTTGEGVAATVVHREYFGHDQLITVRLESGRLIRARTGYGFDLAAGAHCTLRVSEPATVLSK
jgi:iron(III) transport system ATP-binding protein